MATHAPLPASVVGNSFVMRYYTVLNSSPDLLHHFYQEQSVCSHGTEGQVSEAASGMKNIHAKLSSSFPEKGSTVTLSVVDIQESLEGSVIVMVIGSMSTPGRAPKRFVQSFVLARQQPEGFYVRNDLLRYVHEEKSEHVAPAVAGAASSAPSVVPEQRQEPAHKPADHAPAPATPAPAAQPAPAQAHPTPAPAAPAQPAPAQPAPAPSQPTPAPKEAAPAPAAQPKEAHKEQHHPEKAAPAPQQAAPTSTPAPAQAPAAAPKEAAPQTHAAAPAKEAAPAKPAEKPVEKPAVKPVEKPAAAPAAEKTAEKPADAKPAKGFSWASVAAAAASTPAPVPAAPAKKEAQPKPAPTATPAAGAAPAAPATQAAPAATQNQQQPAGANKPQKLNKAELEADPTWVYVNNLPYSTTLDNVVKVFSAYGAIKNSEPHIAKGYAFLKYETKEIAASVIEQAKKTPVNMEGRHVTVDWRQTKPVKDRRNKPEKGDRPHKPKPFANGANGSPKDHPRKPKDKPQFNTNAQQSPKPTPAKDHQ